VERLDFDTRDEDAKPSMDDEGDDEDALPAVAIAMDINEENVAAS